MARSPASRVSWVLLVVVLAAFAVGAASSILLSAPSTAPSGPSTLLDVALTSWESVVLSAVTLGAFVAALVVMRGAGSSNPTLNRMAVTMLVVVVIAVAFLVLAHAFGFGPSNTGGNGGSSHNGNSTLPPPTGGKNLTGPGGNIISWGWLPAWVPFVVLAAIALVAVIVVLPGVRGYVSERRARGSSAATATAAMGFRDALSRASTDLDLGGDPREVILALYAALLARLSPMVAELDVSTPEEIRASHLVRLGVRPEAARTLTRLFEEARYSAHPMGAEAGQRAREAVRATLDDLDRRNFPA